MQYILGIGKLSSREYKKIRYSLNGMVLANVTDCLTEDNLICRTDGNTKYFIEDGIVLKKVQQVRLFPIKEKGLESKGIDNPNIGVIDTETFKTSEGYEIYCLGFKTNLVAKPVTYYVDKIYDSEKRKYVYNSKEIVLNLINELLKPKYNQITFYCHNFGGYDVVFILKVILEHNDINPDTRYKLDIIFRDNRILSIKITQKLNGLTRMLTIKDSYPLLDSSLEKLGKDFNVETLKGVFPYTFSTEDNLYYEGNTPPLSFYNDISNKDYVSMCKTD